jgi:hypothetical protein
MVVGIVTRWDRYMNLFNIFFISLIVPNLLLWSMNTEDSSSSSLSSSDPDFLQQIYNQTIMLPLDCANFNEEDYETISEEGMTKEAPDCGQQNEFAEILISFNVLGKIMFLPIDALKKDDGLLKTLVTNDEQSHLVKKDPDGNILLLTDPQVFKVIRYFLMCQGIPSDIDDFFLREASNFFQSFQLTKYINDLLKRRSVAAAQEYSIITQAGMRPICPICNTKIEKANNDGYACTLFLNHLTKNHCNINEMVVKVPQK